MPNYYPIMLDIRRRPALVIGGNSIAAEKAAALAASGALVTVMNPEFCDELLTLAQRDQVMLRYKAYDPGDLAGAFVVVAATDDQQLIEAIWATCIWHLPEARCCRARSPTKTKPVLHSAR